MNLRQSSWSASLDDKNNSVFCSSTFGGELNVRGSMLPRRNRPAGRKPDQHWREICRKSTCAISPNRDANKCIDEIFSFRHPINIFHVQDGSCFLFPACTMLLIRRAAAVRVCSCVLQ